tara:strand:+ start:51 stop:527 length:477 start_codon:yes stop_codon:yes gene_type:complete
MKWLGLIGNLLGIGEGALERRSALKKAKLDSDLKVIEARANAQVTRINSNTVSDNQLDLMAKEQQATSYKDEVVSFIFLMPLVVATVNPFLVAYKTSNWIGLTEQFVKSYDSLNKFPTWYIVGVVLVVIDILGFRSFLRKAFTAWLDRKISKLGLLKP